VIRRCLIWCWKAVSATIAPMVYLCHYAAVADWPQVVRQEHLGVVCDLFSTYACWINASDWVSARLVASSSGAGTPASLKFFAHGNAGAALPHPEACAAFDTCITSLVLGELMRIRCLCLPSIFRLSLASGRPTVGSTHRPIG